MNYICPKCHAEKELNENALPHFCPSCGAQIGLGNKPGNAIASSIQLPVPDAALREEMVAKWKSLKLWMILALSSLAAGTLLLVIYIGIPILIFGFVALVFALIRQYQLFYRYWSYIGPEKGYTPGQMAGFIFIPFFNLYWIFQMYWKLATRLNEAGDRQVNPGLALTYCILWCCDFIPYIGFISPIPVIIIFFLLHSAMNRAFTGGDDPAQNFVR